MRALASAGGSRRRPPGSRARDAGPGQRPADGGRSRKRDRSAARRAGAAECRARRLPVLTRRVSSMTHKEPENVAKLLRSGLRKRSADMARSNQTVLSGVTQGRDRDAAPRRGSVGRGVPAPARGRDRAARQGDGGARLRCRPRRARASSRSFTRPWSPPSSSPRGDIDYARRLLDADARRGSGAPHHGQRDALVPVDGRLHVAGEGRPASSCRSSSSASTRRRSR